MNRPARFRDALTILALLVSGSAAVLSARQLGAARETIARTRLSSLRAEGQDRLIGKRIDLQSLVPVRPMVVSAEAKRSTLVWVLQLDRCSGCFDTVSEWVRLEQLSDYDLILVLVGRSTPAVEARLRALSRTVVHWGSQARVDSALGDVLPNTKLLLDSLGVAVLVDTRASGQECGWNFEAQISALAGVGQATAIRTKKPDTSL